MTEIGNAYGLALYELAVEEGVSEEILAQMTALDDSFRQEPGFVRLLSSPSLSKEERCRILDDSFGGRIHRYLLNFMKILTEKGYMGSFSDCRKAFLRRYYADHNIVSVTAVTAVPLTRGQTDALTEKLSRATGKTVLLQNRLDPQCLGGVRLDYDGLQMDDTVAHRLGAIRDLLKNTVL